MRRPSFQFYPADYRNNANLRRCSWEAKGAWVEVMGLMHDSDEYGLLRWTLKDIAKAIGAPIRLLKELVDKGVLKGSQKDGEKVSFSTTISQRNSENLTIFLLKNEEVPLYFSSRMVRDEFIRNRRGDNGIKSLKNINVPRKKDKDKDTFSESNSMEDKDTTSPSPTSSSTSTTTDIDISDPNNLSNKLNNSDTLALLARARDSNQKMALGVTINSQQNFDRFREIYPKPGNWLEAQIAWVQQKCDDIAEIIFVDIPKRLAEHSNWKRGARWVLNPENYLKRREWENAIITDEAEADNDNIAYSGPRDAERLRAEQAAKQRAKQGLD